MTELQVSSSTVGTNSRNDFWSILENVIKNEPQSLSLNQHIINDSSNNDQEEIHKYLSALKPSEPINVRLKACDEILKLIDLYSLNESTINCILRSIRDLTDAKQTPLFETRKLVFEFLTELIKKKPIYFETFLIRNYLLSLIINTNKTSSQCLFINLINALQPSTNNSTKTTASTTNIKIPTASPIKEDDLKLRFNLFYLITKNGDNFDYLDPELAIECLIYFLNDDYNSHQLIDKNEQIFTLFKNIIEKNCFQFIDDNLLLLLTKFILNFSFLITKQINFSNAKILINSKQINEINQCINLISKLINQLTSIDCINHVVLCLCELLDLVWQSSQQINNNTQLNEIITNIYECMNKLFVSPIGNCAIFTFFNEIFPPNKKNQIHRSHQINGALLHIKQIFEDFKQSKLKNAYLIKELHLNCLMYLPNALKSYSTEINQQQKIYMFDHIINLTIELVNLATHRDLFMCLLTFNSRQFLIEIVGEFSDKLLENEQLIRKYAELLNLLDEKKVFAYKTTSGKEASANANSDDISWLFQRFKETFYELVHKFAYSARYLKEQCINNCIEFYFKSKLLPTYGSREIQKQLTYMLEKYFNNKPTNRFSLNVRKFLCETIHKRLKDYYYGGDQKIFTEELIYNSILPQYERIVAEDDEFYHSQQQTQHQIDSSELIDMKCFLVQKLIDLTHYCNNESTLYRIVKIFDKIIKMEKNSCIEILTSHSTSPILLHQSSSQSNLILSPVSQTTSSTNSLPINNNSNSSQSLYYLNKIINNGLIDLFEKNFSSNSATTEHSFTLCCVEIYNILIRYLDYYYTNLLTNSNACNKESASITSLLRTPSFSGEQNNQVLYQQQTQQIAQHKFFNYYAQIRRDIFEFLLRIRSDKFKRLLMVNKNNRRKLIESKFLVITLNQYDDRLTTMNRCQLDFGKLLRQVEHCLEKETDWNVLMRVLNDLPYVLQYEMDLITKSDFIQRIFRLLCNSKKEITLFRNRPDNLQKSDYQSKYNPLIASIVLYHPLLDKNSQEFILQLFATGVNTNRNRYCLETLTIAITEMHETNSIQCGDILLKLSQFTPHQTMAQPVLELLSTMSDFKKLDFIFGRKELYISVLAIAIKYTNPMKYNSFIIQLAHYVICIWFIKCKPEFRKNYASFTNKGLQKEVILELELSKENKVSPNKSSNEILSSSQTDSKDQTKPTNTIVLNDVMKQFYKDLVEITMDFMSNNMYFDCSINAQLTSAHNRNEFFIDYYSNEPNSLIDQSKQKGQSKFWLMGNKIIEIRTGSFSNICLEDPSSYLLRKQRVNSVSVNNSSNASTTKNNQTLNKPTPAIDIPGSSSQLLINESIASSEQSSTNNSFGSVSLNSNYNNKNNSSNTGTPTISITNKSEKDFFDETIDSSTASASNLRESEILSSTELVKESSNLVNKNENQQTQRSRRIVKRRYNSGLPLSSNFTDNSSEQNEESLSSNIKQYLNYNDSSSKQSKDDFSIEKNKEDFSNSNNNNNNNNIDSDNQSLNSLKISSSNQKVCNQNCWCNYLVEITLRYPTKMISYVSLIENNISTSHYVNTTLFEKLLKTNRLTKLSETLLLSEKREMNTNNISLARIAANAIEMRRNSQLSRISESSMLSQDTNNIPSPIPSSGGSGNIYENSIIEGQQHESKTSRFLNSELNRRTALSRKGSFDLSSIPSTSINYETNRLRQQTTILNNEKFLNSSLSSNSSNITNLKSSSSLPIQPSPSNSNTNLDPSQVFLQLFQNQFDVKQEQPVLIPENNDNILRSIKMLDYLPAYMLHKVGVIYMGKNQADDEKAILANSTGSLRYKMFVNGLGNLIYLKEMDTLRFYTGGWETDGCLGDFNLLWSDGIAQMSFHVATMMLLKDDDVNTKKRHIGNDPAIIVYNESGEEYQFSMIKGEINCICIEIIPLESSNTNIVKVKTNTEIGQSQWFTHSEPKFVSDQNLSLIVRKMALHASMASRIYRSQKDNNIFGDKWYERLRQINRIRKLTKDFYSKQQQQKEQQQQQQQQQNNQKDNKTLNANNSNSTSSNNSTNNITTNPTDFTTYI